MENWSHDASVVMRWRIEPWPYAAMDMMWRTSATMPSWLRNGGNLIVKHVE